MGQSANVLPEVLAQRSARRSNTAVVGAATGVGSGMWHLLRVAWQTTPNSQPLWRYPIPQEKRCIHRVAMNLIVFSQQIAVLGIHLLHTSAHIAFAALEIHQHNFNHTHSHRLIT